MKKFLPAKLSAIYLPKVICTHLIGDKHTFFHRITVGMFIMVLGVELAEIGSTIHLFSILLTTGGYALHAVGAVPIIEWLLKFRE